MTRALSIGLCVSSAAVLTLPAAAGSVSCGGARECHAQHWSGTCTLFSVTRVRETTLPLPGVVFEGIYRPQTQPNQGVSLPDVRREFTALSKHEDALRQHIEGNESVRCYLNPPSPGECVPGELIVDVPDFDATRAQATPVDDGPKGCAQIDDTSTQDRLSQTQGDERSVGQPIAERFQFGESSAELPPEASALADSVAQRLKANPQIQCVGVVGQFVRGENLSTAFDRARAVRELLIQRGIEPERLVALTVDRPMTGAGSTPQPPNPQERRVSLSILLELPAEPAPAP